MNILFCLDKNYAQFLPVQINAILKNNHHKCKINFYIVHPDIDLDTQNQIKNYFTQQASSNAYINQENFVAPTITFIQAEQQNLNKLPICIKHLSPIANARIFLNDIYDWSQVDRLLYLDMDVVILEDLYDLFYLDLQGKTVGACVDVGIEDLQRDYKDRIGLAQQYHYVNSGVLLIDMRKWAAKNVTEKAIEWLHKYKDVTYFADQDIINCLFTDEIYYMNPRYNYLQMYQERLTKYFAGELESLSPYEEATFPIVVFHTAGKFKAWYSGKEWTWKTKYWQQEAAAFNVKFPEVPLYILEEEFGYKKPKPWYSRAFRATKLAIFDALGIKYRK